VVPVPVLLEDAKESIHLIQRTKTEEQHVI